MSYLGYLCYRHSYDDDNDLLDETTTLEFIEPPLWKYAKVIPIQFSPLMSWSDKDSSLFTKGFVNA